MSISSPSLNEGTDRIQTSLDCSLVSGLLACSAGRILAKAALLLSTLILLMLGASQAGAEAGRLADRLTPDVMAIVWPDAESLGPEEGAPPAVAVHRGGKIVGYVFSTLDIVKAQGFSIIPFDVIAGVDTTGRISGSKVIFHREPHVHEDEIRQPQLDAFLAQTAGLASLGVNAGALPPDYVAGATVSARAMREAVFNSAQLVLIGRGLSKAPASEPSPPAVDIDGFKKMSWEELLAEGSIVHRVITNAEVAAALGKSDPAGGKLDVPLDSSNNAYIDIYTGLATPASINRNVLGDAYGDYFGPRGKSMFFFSQKIFVASKGPYDFLGPKRFDRLRLVQGDKTYQFTSSQYQGIATGGRNGIRALDHAAVFTLPADARFDPLKPWRLELLVNGQTAAGSPVSLAFPINYQLPTAHMLLPPTPAPPAWIQAWRDSRTNVIIEAALLSLLTVVLIFQAKLAQSRRAHRIIRNSFLLFVLVWEGWIAGGQLSIFNIINYMWAPFRHFDLGFYLAEPLMVMIVIYTAISLVLLGRGVFCGWLCPFGALQELLAHFGRFIGMPAFDPSESAQKYLRFGKYVSAALVLSLAALSGEMGSRIAEVEPFNTAITSHFTRAWPYVFYACALLVIGLFTERAYCRFLCPLGGVLAFLGRLHLLELLKRRPECGSPCHLCENSCPVKAIAGTGEIKMAECFQCLDCQVEYFDDRRCPPLAAIRKNAVRQTAGGRAPALAMAADKAQSAGG